MAADPVTAGLDAADDALKVGLQVGQQENTPAEITARTAQQVQDLRDKINRIMLLATGSTNHEDTLYQIRRLCAGV
jgi:hypothetical protein